MQRDNWLVTICPACHAVVHKLRAHRRWLPVPLLELWREQHPSVPVQLQIEICQGGGDSGAENQNPPEQGSEEQGREDKGRKEERAA